jgi:hypothetical protein
MAARAQNVEPAFSDDEFEGIDMEGVPRMATSSPEPRDEDTSEVPSFIFPNTATGIESPS